MLFCRMTTSICKAISASSNPHTTTPRPPKDFGAPLPPPTLSGSGFILCGLRDRAALEGALLWTIDRGKAKQTGGRVAALRDADFGLRVDEGRASLQSAFRNRHTRPLPLAVLSARVAYLRQPRTHRQTV